MSKKVAILGGGMSALTAAYEIMTGSAPGEYEITVYQLGWRLGGKLATGRNYLVDDRIEEHGIHVLFGSYENVFYCLRRVLADLAIDDWQSLFQQRSSFTAMEETGGWRVWNLTFPQGMPGLSRDPQALPGDALFANEDATQVPEMVSDALEWIPQRLAQMLSRHGWIGRRIARCFEAHVQRGRDAGRHPELEVWLTKALRLIYRFHRTHWIASHALRWIPAVSRLRDELRHIWILAELALVGLVGLRRAGNEDKTFEDLDDQDLREWLDSNSLLGSQISRTTRDSAVLRMIYELIFAYRDGDVNRPALAAGTALRAVLRLFLDYRGAFVWAMKRGSETLVTPFYKVLKQQGVKFEFFHRVDELVAENDTVSRVRMSIQARAIGEYDPLYKGNSWPATPKYGDLEPGSGLDTGDEFKPPLMGKNLEYDRTRARPVGSKEIVFGEDYDTLVLALPPDELKLRANFAGDSQWQAMLCGLNTTATVAAQLWLDQDTQELGWRDAIPATVGTYAQPLPDWIDLGQTIDYEGWPDDDKPRSVIYLVGTLPARSKARDLRLETREAGQMVGQWLTRSSKRIWPEATDGRSFEWRLLHDASGEEGEVRLQSQYYRMNLDRAERYTLSLPGTTRTRLRADESRYRNLVVCGDWTDNGLNVGAVEAAVMSGRQAARAVLGRYFKVYGETLTPGSGDFSAATAK